MDLKRATVLAACGVAAMAWLAWEPPAGGPDETVLGTGPAAAGQAADPGRDPGDEASGRAAAESPQRSCDIVSQYLPAGDGTATEVFSCEPGERATPHPYEGYPTEALESLAYADPDAAAVLSLRWRETNTAAAMSLALRAAALSGGDATPIVAFSNAYPGPTAVDNVPVRETVRVKYVLGTVIRLLGDERHSTPYFEAIIAGHSQDPEHEIALLRQRADALLEEMRQIQLDVTGSSTIGG